MSNTLTSIYFSLGPLVVAQLPPSVSGGNNQNPNNPLPPVGVPQGGLPPSVVPQVQFQPQSLPGGMPPLPDTDALNAGIARCASQMADDMLVAQQNLTLPGNRHNGILGALSFSTQGGFYYFHPIESNVSDTGRYFWAPLSSGSNTRTIFYTGGSVTNRDGRITIYPPSTSLDAGRTWMVDGNLSRLPLWAQPICDLRLVPDVDGVTYRVNAEGQEHYLAPGGLICRQDGFVYENGNWVRRNFPEGTTNLYRLNAIPLTDGTWRYMAGYRESHGDSMVVLRDGRILMLAAWPNDLRIFTFNNGTWTRIGNRVTSLVNPYPQDQEISQGILSILSSRRSRNWVSSVPPPVQQVAPPRPQSDMFVRNVYIPRRMSTAICHSPQQNNSNGFRLSLTGQDLTRDHRRFTNDELIRLLGNNGR